MTQDRSPASLRAQPSSTSVSAPAAGTTPNNENRKNGDVLPSSARLDKAGYLSAVDLLKCVSQQDMEWLEKTTTMLQCRRGKVIYGPGEVSETLFLIKKGSVQIYRLGRDGKKLILANLGEGAFFGEMALLGQGTCQSFAEAVEDSLLCAMKRHHIERLLASYPQVAVNILEIMGRRLLATEMMLEEIAFKSVRSRIASLLLRLSQQQGSDVISGLSHQALADMSGTIRETATQSLNELRAQGLIEISRMCIKILDFDRLKEEAEF